MPKKNSVRTIQILRSRIMQKHNVSINIQSSSHEIIIKKGEEKIANILYKDSEHLLQILYELEVTDEFKR